MHELLLRLNLHRQLGGGAPGGAARHGAGAVRDQALALGVEARAVADQVLDGLATVAAGADAGDVARADELREGGAAAALDEAREVEGLLVVVVEGALRVHGRVGRRVRELGRGVVEGRDLEGLEGGDELVLGEGRRQGGELERASGVGRRDRAPNRSGAHDG